jgi:hypothetical protein
MTLNCLGGSPDTTAAGLIWAVVDRLPKTLLAYAQVVPSGTELRTKMICMVRWLRTDQFSLEISLPLGVWHVGRNESFVSPVVQPVVKQLEWL